MEAPASRWLMAERVVSAATTPKMGVRRCFLRDNMRGLCSRLTQSPERLRHANARRAIRRDGGKNSTIRARGHMLRKVGLKVLMEMAFRAK